ncbi:MAG TPA: carboxypeptidase-like regulatory domain-containing protein, partial [Blastocatellia bacterium]
MPALSRAAILTALMLSIVAMATARPASQQAKELKEPTATVAGRVTIGGKPAPGVMVMLLPYANYANNQAVARGNTDEDGRFRLSRVPAGRYAVRSFAPAFVSDGDEPIAQPEKLIVISDGETIEGINLALKRGGVITGRVTDASGRPMIEEQVILYFMNEQEQKRPYYPAN